MEMGFEWGEQCRSGGLRILLRKKVGASVGVGSEEPGPDSSLVVGGVAGAAVAAVVTMERGIIGGQRAQAERYEQRALDRHEG